MRKLILVTLLVFVVVAIADKMRLADDIAPKNDAFNVMVDMRYIGDGDLDISADADYNHYLDLAYGGLNADTTAFDGLLKISGGAISAVADNSSTWNTLTGSYTWHYDLGADLMPVYDIRGDESDYFEINSSDYSELQPIVGSGTSAGWELDGNDDLQPKA